MYYLQAHQFKHIINEKRGERSVLNRIIKAIFSILYIACLSVLMLSLTGCEDEPPVLHVFDFRTPVGFDELTAEEKFEWAKSNGYFVTSFIAGAEKEYADYNKNLLDSFLAHTADEKELLILHYSPGDARVSGIYFDGEYYHTTRKLSKTSDATAFHYFKICGLEVDSIDYKHLYVSNDKKLTAYDEYWAYASSTDCVYEFQKQYYTVALLGKN